MLAAPHRPPAAALLPSPPRAPRAKGSPGQASFSPRAGPMGTGVTSPAGPKGREQGAGHDRASPRPRKEPAAAVQHQKPKPVP